MSGPPNIGEIFSSDSDDDFHIKGSNKSRSRSRSRSMSNPPVHINVNRWHGSNPSYDSDGRLRGGQRKEESELAMPVLEPDRANDGYLAIDLGRANSIKANTLVYYETNAGKVVKPKYFKKIDTIANEIVVGFFTHGKRTYTESLNNIKNFYVRQTIKEDGLKETIEIPREQWKSIRRDMVISYEKSNKEMVHKVRFNSFLKGTEGAVRMSLTSERGYNYIANPDNIQRIYRHITSQDKTLTLILEALRKLDNRVQFLEKSTNAAKRV